MVMEIAQADQVVSTLEYTDGIEVLGPNRLRVAALDRLGGVTPAMIDWWFSRMDEETYYRFHPVDHKAFAWVRGKTPGAHIGATHLTHHCYGGQPPLLPSEITFIPPSELLDETAFAAAGVGAVIAAVAYALDPDGHPFPTEAGRFIHVAVERGYGTELRSSWWLNTTPETDLDVVTNRRLRHVHEEFAYLAGFLPGLYTTETGK
jgi:hypothetical protein